VRRRAGHRLPDPIWCAGEIAFASGFQSRPHFDRAFMQIAGGTGESVAVRRKKSRIREAR
jgi:transcriptional regulator GlxA family with amidase domain